MRLDITRFNRLEDHLRLKMANHPWVEASREEAAAFPYRLVEGGRMTVHPTLHAPEWPQEMPEGEGSQDPTYLINIPMAFRSLKADPHLLTQLLRMIGTQAFGIFGPYSEGVVRRRVAAVVGVNFPASLDPARNRSALFFMNTLPKVEGIASRVFAFLLLPQWTQPKGLYPVRKAFKILKALNAPTTEKILSLFETGELLGSQISMLQIREFILRRQETRAFADHFVTVSPHAPSYFVVMDADAHALRLRGTGLFSRVDHIVADHNTPSAITCGYQVPGNERPIIRLGVIADMNVRAAMNSVVPYSAYFPEPASFFIYRRADRPHRLSSLSFLGRGRVLETRRLIQNGRRNGLFDDNSVFLAKGGVVTSTQPKMITLKNSRVKKLTPKKLKQMGNLKSLRAVSQSHISPRDWAENLYVALGFTSPQKTDITSLMARIYAIFDPIARMQSHIGRYTAKVYDDTLGAYANPLTPVQQEVITSARNQLAIKGMPAAKIDLIVQAAQASGLALFKTLRDAPLPMACP